MPSSFRSGLLDRLTACPFAEGSPEGPATGFARCYTLLLQLKTGSLASPNCRSSLKGFLASRTHRSLRSSRFGASTQFGRNGPVSSIRSRDRARGPSRAAAHPLIVFLQRRGVSDIAFGDRTSRDSPLWGLVVYGPLLKVAAWLPCSSSRPVVSHVRARVIPLGLPPAPSAGCFFGRCPRRSCLRSAFFWA